MITLAVLLFTVHCLPFTPFAAAQIPDEGQYPEDTLSDTLSRDTVNTTARFLKEQEQVSVRVPVLPLLGIEGPKPALTRIVFNRDSIEWGHAATVGDLLTQVPGVYLWRGGFIGRPELVNYHGRGSASAEYYLDGVPYVAAGPDSLSVDPALFSIAFLDRIEVERWPGQLRVYLFTLRHDRLAPRSAIAVARGDNNFARYGAELERRFVNGFGFSLAGDYLSSPTVAVRNSSYSNTQIWAQGSYIPSPRFGVQYQLVRSAPNRRPFVTTATRHRGHDRARLQGQPHRRAVPAVAQESGGRAGSLDSTCCTPEPGGPAPGWTSRSTRSAATCRGGRRPSPVAGSAFHRTRWTPLDARATWAGTRSPRSLCGRRGCINITSAAAPATTPISPAGSS